MFKEAMANFWARNEEKERARNRNSTIKVEPRITWPTLGDDGPGGREVLDFYERFEEFCDLANDGWGMADREQLIALKNCLKQSNQSWRE